MRSEKVQFDMLCEQNVRNVWRKKGFNKLLKESHTIGEQADPNIHKVLDIFSERIDYSVDNAIPVKIPFTKKIDKLISEHKMFLAGDYEKMQIDSVQSLLTTVRKRKESFNEEDEDEDDSAQSFL